MIYNYFPDNFDFFVSSSGQRHFNGDMNFPAQDIPFEAKRIAGLLWTNTYGFECYVCRRIKDNEWGIMLSLVYDTHYASGNNIRLDDLKEVAWEAAQKIADEFEEVDVYFEPDSWDSESDSKADIVNIFINSTFTREDVEEFVRAIWDDIY